MWKRIAHPSSEHFRFLEHDLLVLKLLQLAASLAITKNPKEDFRAHWMAAVGVRGDGTTVSSRNGSVISLQCHEKGWSFPQAHAEARVCRKMDYNGTVYVARVSRGSGDLMLARPCYDCEMKMRSRFVKRVYYSVSNTEYGVMDLQGQERIVKH